MQTTTCHVVIEQTLGHVTHSQNLRRYFSRVEGFEPTFIPVEFDVTGARRHLPGWNNWTIRAGIRARSGLRSARGAAATPADALFVHTQVPAILLGRQISATPTVISLDATPIQYDALGEHYDHDVGGRRVEALKARLHAHCFHRAAHLVTWSSWTKQSLVDDYGVDESDISVIPPGVDVERWLRTAEPAPTDEPVRLLFVGGNLARKGGFDLLAAFATLRDRHGDQVELHLVTPADVDAPPGVTVHRSMTPNSQDLIDLYHRCQVFCLPTLGDCLPMVLPEAGAAGLALVSTDVGAIHEIVRDDETGLLVPVGDVTALTDALERLVTDPELRSRLAGAANALVRSEHSAARNAERITGAIVQAVERAR